LSGEFLAQRLFPALKQSLGGHKFKYNPEVETVVTGWLTPADRDGCQQRIKRLVPRYDECLSYGGGMYKSSTVKSGVIY
jgi:hypothetical protein